MSRDQFVTEWLERSGLRFLPSNRFPMVCSCGDSTCAGWAMEYVE
jgi:hypothetical protein